MEGGPTSPSLLGGTLTTLISRYLGENGAKVAYRSLCSLNRFMRDPITRIPLGDLTLSDWHKYRYRRSQEGIKPQTTIRDLTPVSIILGHAKMIWGLDNLPNWVSLSHQRVRQIKRKRRFQPGELEALLQAIDEMPMQPESLGRQLRKDIVVFASEVPFRLGEIALVKVRHVTNYERVFMPTSKTREQRHVIMTLKASEILKRRMEDLGPNELVFPFRPKQFTDSIRFAIKRAGLEHFRFQDTKHEATSRLFEKGLSAPEVMLQTGHTNLRTLSIYSHAQVENVISKLRS